MCINHYKFSASMGYLSREIGNPGCTELVVIRACLSDFLWVKVRVRGWGLKLEG